METLEVRAMKKRIAMAIWMLLVSVLLAACTEMKCEYTGDIERNTWLYVVGNQVYYIDWEGDIKQVDPVTKKERMIDGDVFDLFNIKGDWLYKIDEKINLIACNLVTGEKKMIDEGNSDEFLATGETLLFTTGERTSYGSKYNEHIYKQNLKDEKKEALYDVVGGSWIRGLAVYEGYLYFVDETVETGGQEQVAWRINLATGEREPWETYTEMIGASDEWLYFHKAKYDPGYIRSGDKEPSYDDTIYRIKKDGSKKEIVYEKKETWDLLHYQGVWCMNDWIVYIGPKDNKIYKMKESEKNKTLIVDKAVRKLAVYGDVMYFLDEEGNLYTNDILGGKEEKIN